MEKQVSARHFYSNGRVGMARWSLILDDVKVLSISFIADSNHLKSYLEADVKAGLRDEDVIKFSLDSLQIYENLDTIKVDTSHGKI